MATNLIKKKQNQQYITIGKLTTGLLHDLINPLSAILLNLEEVVNNSKLNSNDKHQYCQEALKATYCLNQFISDVSCQIEAKAVKEIFNLKKLINSSKTLFNYQLLKNSTNLIIDIPANIEIIGVKNSLCRTVNNLLANAIRACQERKENYQSCITIKCLNSKSHFEIKVIDNGIGLASTMKDNLFKEFKSTKTEKSALSGFGLYSSLKMIQEDYQGNIEYRKAKIGSIFIIQIPKKLVKKGK
jgi:signal transduction histidine kinase